MNRHCPTRLWCNGVGHCLKNREKKGPVERLSRQDQNGSGSGTGFTASYQVGDSRRECGGAWSECLRFHVPARAVCWPFLLAVEPLGHFLCLPCSATLTLVRVPAGACLCARVYACGLLLTVCVGASQGGTPKDPCP